MGFESFFIILNMFLNNRFWFLNYKFWCWTVFTLFYYSFSIQYANKWKLRSYHLPTPILPKHSKSSYLSPPVMPTASSPWGYYQLTPVMMKNSKFLVLDRLYLVLLLNSIQYANKWQPRGYHLPAPILPNHSKSSYLSTPVRPTNSSWKSFYLSPPVMLKNSKFWALSLSCTHNMFIYNKFWI